MGSSKVSARAPAPQIVYVPQAPVQTISQAENTPTSTQSQTEQSDTPQAQSERRSQSLLRRERSRLGTIISGFRGVLGLSDKTNQRKSLLGE